MNDNKQKPSMKRSGVTMKKQSSTKKSLRLSAKEKQLSTMYRIASHLTKLRRVKMMDLNDEHVPVNGNLVKYFFQTHHYDHMIVHVMLVRNADEDTGVPDLKYNLNHVLLFRDNEAYEHYGKNHLSIVRTYQKFDSNRRLLEIPFSSYEDPVKRFGAVRVNFYDESFLTELFSKYNFRSCMLSFLDQGEKWQMGWLSDIEHLYMTVSDVADNNDIQSPKFIFSCNVLHKLKKLETLYLDYNYPPVDNRDAFIERSIIEQNKSTLKNFGVSVD